MGTGTGKPKKTHGLPVQLRTCELLYVVHFLLTRWDAVLAVRSRWGDRGDSQANSLRWPRGGASVDDHEGSHFLQCSSSFEDFSSFVDGIVIRRGGGGTVLRRSGRVTT